jgi:tyrosyl-tRNA synthetase
MPIYDFEKVKKAILFNSAEVLPTTTSQLDEEIRVLVDEANKSGEVIRHYIGFEISGQVHLGTGMSTAIKLKALEDAGIRCSIWFANYHTWLNGKLDGTLETIDRVNNEYFKPVFIECCKAVGCDVDKIDFIDARSLYEQKRRNQTFFTFVMKIAQNLTLARVNKSVTITGKKAGENVNFGVLMYPVMQVADPFFMQAHIVHAGMDQRKCHVLMREVAPSLEEDFDLRIGEKKIKPIAMHHHLLLGLGIDAKAVGNRMSTDQGKEKGEEFEEMKMSKSNPDAAVWVHDNHEEIYRKLKKAYCPMPQEGQDIEQIRQEQEYNPILNWCKYLIYAGGRHINIQEPEKFGGKKTTYQTYEELEKAYFEKKIHPLDLKQGVATALSEWFAPIREYVEQNPKGLELVKSVRK